MRIPILTYHGNNISGDAYDENDHVALAEDLRLIAAEGWKIVSLDTVVDWHEGRIADEVPERALAISFDDGTDFDWYDLPHPEFGLQRSLFNVLTDFRATRAGQNQPGLHATCFVITSPGARAELDRKGLAGRGWWGEEWWRPALGTGLLGIGCHSWDHVHPLLDEVAQRDQVKGDFKAVASYGDCEAQVEQAGRYITDRLGGTRPVHFAYPWGEASEYLVLDYLPHNRARHGFRAAYTTDARPVTRADSRWTLPRFVCGPDWKSPDELKSLLRDCAA